MTPPRFLADADIRREIVRGLKRLAPAAEFEIVRKIGMGASHDRDILEFAAVHGWIVVSHDVNTMSRYAAERITLGKPMLGLLLVRQEKPTGGRWSNVSSRSGRRPTLASGRIKSSTSRCSEWP